MPSRMTAASCKRDEAYLRAFRALVEDPRARREWLWLRAREKDDAESLECLARADPELPARMAAIDAEFGAIADPRARREAYGRKLDLRSAHLESRRVACDCEDCRRADAQEARC